MIRLFLSLFAIMILIFIGYLMGVNPVANFLFSSTVADLRQQQMGGIITQLDEGVAGLNDTQIQQRLVVLQEMFRYDVNLIAVDKLELANGDMQRLRQGELIIQRQDGAEFIYKRSVVTDHAWHLQLDPTLTERNQQFLVGPLALVEEKLSVLPQQEWPEAVRLADQQFGIPLHLIDQQAIDNNSRITQQQRAELLAGEMVIFSAQNNLIEYVYYRLLDSQYYLQVGKVQLPLLLRYANLVVLMLLAVLLGLAIWLWLRPVWTDLRRLKLASEGFGQGQLTTRIPVSRFSFIKTILQAFNQMAGRIEQLITSHKTLTNAVSHELRTPVSRLRFSLAMLEKTPQSSEQQRHLADMNADIDELDDMLAALLSYARMDRQDVKLEKTPLILETWLREQVQHATAQANNSGSVEIEVICQNLATTETAVMDAKLMARALQNLLQNAQRYAKQNIRVGFSQLDKHYELRVEDDGCGIPKHYHEQLFEPFTRVDESRGRDSGGYGLGLAIVKQIASMHQGEVSIENSTLGGACFVIRWS